VLAFWFRVKCCTRHWGFSRSSLEVTQGGRFSFYIIFFSFFSFSRDFRCGCIATTLILYTDVDVAKLEISAF